MSMDTDMEMDTDTDMDTDMDMDMDMDMDARMATDMGQVQPGSGLETFTVHLFSRCLHILHRSKFL
jgi:hypothetical protein